MSNLEDFDKEIECFYKEERYAVRDNGAVLRRPIDGKKKAPLPRDSHRVAPKLKTIIK